jgi:glycosyltransferase involved in cell wall biosynthesis
VVVFSDHTRRELLSDALVEEARIRVVPPGLDHRTAQPTPQRPAGLDDDHANSPADGFMLCLGTDFLPQEQGLRAAPARVAASAPRLGRGRLVLAGTHIPVGSSLELEQAPSSRSTAELRDSVVALGPVSEEEKAWLIAHAGAVLYPSVYEGFGLVPFESALQGVPCVFALAVLTGRGGAGGHGDDRSVGPRGECRRRARIC